MSRGARLAGRVATPLAIAVLAALAAGLGASTTEAGFWPLFGIMLGFAVAATALLYWRWQVCVGVLTDVARRIGEGETDARVGAHMGAPLGRIAAAIDRMAEDLQARQAQLQYLTDLINRSPVVAAEWRLAPDWPLSFISDGVARWGYDKQDLLSGRIPFGELFHPDDRAAVEAQIAHHFAHGPDDYRQVYRLRTAAGDYVWLDDRTWLARNEAGEVVAAYGVLLDVTEQKRAEEVERQLRNRLETVANASPVLFWTAGLDMRCDWFNEVWLRFTGRTEVQERGWGWLQGVHPDDRERVRRVFESCFAVRESFSIEFRLRRCDGEYCWVLDQGMPCHDADGAFEGFIGCLLEITVEKQIEAALRESEARYRELFESNPHPMMVYDAETLRFLAVNDAAVDHYGYSREEFLGMTLLEIRPPEDAPALQAYMARRGDVKISRAGVWRHRRKDGSLIDVDIVSHTLLFDGRAARLVLANDITDRLAAEREIRQLNADLEVRIAERTEQLAAANRELEAFTYSVSHDLKAPLRGIDGYSQILLEDYQQRLDEEALHLVHNIRRGVRQMHELIEDLLAYSRMERRALETRMVEVVPLVRSVIEGRQDEIVQRGVAIDERLSPLRLNVDREGLALVVRNLLENALKFTQARSDARIEFGLSTADGRARLWVKDNGIGFDMKYHDRIFEIFQRLHRSEDYPGTGVGLALVRKAVTRMGGRVWAESAPGSGATFYVEFPLCPP
ncbi:MAG: PAS domain S-box protein [Rhodocyclaceae bacterium]